MFSRSKNWVSGGLWKPKNPHSLEHLKYLYGVLIKNQTVTEQNRALLVESLRSISEILIWGDQNDSTVFDFFLEKNMLSFFLQFMKQKYGRFICVQLLQTLNILFENISNETSVYYLLSNNHVNSIIVHKFDFSDEEVMAYYISFLKTLSLRLNKHTIHFFYNEHTNDFPLYTEGIKFFNHSESMVRIAVRTITLNVYKVQSRIDDKSMLRYIRDKTAAPYFSNLVWFIGKNVLDIDVCVRHDTDHNSKDRLADLVAEHLDHLHYLNDILCLNIDALNEVLTDHLLNNLFLPLYVYSLTKSNKYELRSEERPHVSPVVSLFLLSQVFLIMTHKPLVGQLADIVFNQDASIFESRTQSTSPQLARLVCGFVKPRESLAKTLDKNRGTGGTPMKRPNYRNDDEPSTSGNPIDVVRVSGNSTFYEAVEGEYGERLGELEEAKEEYEHITAEEHADEERKEGMAAQSGEIADRQMEAETTAATGHTEKEESHPDVSQRAEAGEVDRDADRQKKTDTEMERHIEDHGEDRQSEAEGSVAASDVTQGESVLSEDQASVDASSSVAETASIEPGDISDVSSTGEAAAGADRLLYHHLTDDEKLASQGVSAQYLQQHQFSLQNRPFLKAIFRRLDCGNHDYGTLFSLCLLYALSHNSGIDQELLDTILLPTDQSASKHHYNTQLMETLIAIIGNSCTANSVVRLATLELCIKLMTSMVMSQSRCFLQDGHLAAIEGAREEATLLLRNFYKSEEIFLDMFEDEFREMQLRPLNVEYLTMDASILLPPTGTPLTGIEFIKRLPCGEVERARKAIRVFFYLRALSLKLQQETDGDLPLTKQEECVKVGDVLDLNNSDLIACTVVTKDQNKRERRFLVIDVLQLILVEPDSRKLGWGLVKFVGFLQDVEVTGDKEDSRSLYITIHKPTMNVHAKPLPLLSARFMFDDHIRCMAAKQRLTKGRLKARQRKMQMIARLLELPAHIVSSMYHHTGGAGMAQSAVIQHASTSSPMSIPGRSHQVKSRTQNDAVKRSVFAGVDQTAAFSGASRGGRQKQKSSSRNTPGVILRRQAGKPQRVTMADQRSSDPQPVRSQRMDRGVVAVEQAVEADDALQAAASGSAAQGVEKVRQKRLSKYYGSSTEKPATPADAQLDEMSAKANKLLLGTRELFKDSRQQLNPSRSISNSPTRKPDSRSNSPRRGRGSRSSSTCSNRSQESPSRGKVGIDACPPSPRTAQRLRRTRSDSPGGSLDSKVLASRSDTQLLQSENMSQSSVINEGDDASQQRPRSMTGPKTLTPAQAPTASLVISCDTSMTDTVAMTTLDSPKLLPPSDEQRIRSFSETSQTSVDRMEVAAEKCASDALKEDQNAGKDNKIDGSNTNERAVGLKHIDEESGSKPESDQTSNSVVINKTCHTHLPPPFMSKSPPVLGESPITADLSRIERMSSEGENATERLTKLVKSASNQSFNGDPQALEMSNRTQPIRVEDEHEEETSTDGV